LLFRVLGPVSLCVDGFSHSPLRAQARGVLGFLRSGSLDERSHRSSCDRVKDAMVQVLTLGYAEELASNRCEQFLIYVFSSVDIKYKRVAVEGL
jgi:hypothetical protein